MSRKLRVVIFDMHISSTHCIIIFMRKMYEKAPRFRGKSVMYKFCTMMRAATVSFLVSFRWIDTP